VSCLDLLDNGVLQGFVINEVNNRTWKSFRFTCRTLKPDGTVTGDSEKSPLLFDFEKAGTRYETTVPGDSLSVGILEIENELQLRESLLSIGIEHARAQAIVDGGAHDRTAADLHVTDRIPKASPALSRSIHWMCPPGMVMTGAAVGHIPNNKDKHTRPVYVLSECRRLVSE
jgi:hypothetical protein